MCHAKIKKTSKMRKAFVGALLTASILILPGQNTFATEGQSETTTITYPYYAFIEDPDNPWGSVWDALDATGTVEYSDSFFTEPSPGDHPKLRALSYALALCRLRKQSRWLSIN